jgi:predicted MFS family arabinose efflux permease
VARFGVGWAFATNSCGYLIMINTLLRWKYKRDAAPEQNTEQFGPAIRAGLEYVKQSRALQAILVRTVMFATACSALWSLLPLLCRQQLHADSVQYGIIVSGFGMGTLLGAIIQPIMRRKLTLDSMSAAGVILFAISMATVACSHAFMLTLLGMLGCGVAWTIKNSSLNVAVQMAAPNWVRARAYSVYLLVFQGCTAAGAMVWGGIATWRSIPDAMMVASIALLLGLVASIWHKLSHAEEMEMEVQNAARPAFAEAAASQEIANVGK